MGQTTVHVFFRHDERMKSLRFQSRNFDRDQTARPTCTPMIVAGQLVGRLDQSRKQPASGFARSPKRDPICFENATIGV